MSNRLSTIGQNLLNNEDGQDLVEYAMILIFVVIVCVVGVTTIGNTLIEVYFNRVLEIFG